MSDYYWPSTPATDLHVSYVTQVKYTAHPTTRGYFQVKATNTNDNGVDHRTMLPTSYLHQFHQFLFRFNLTIRLWKKFNARKAKKIKERIPRLIRIMCHLDNVGEALIRPSLDIPREDITDWRCENFDEYLVTEFLLGRHDPPAVLQFRSAMAINIERIGLETLGMHVSIHLHPHP